MGKKRKILSQAEIWDDSALLQSWEDALEEYKLELYHSIHAKGERIEDVIKAAESDKEHVDERVESKCGLAEEEQVDRGLHKDLEEGELDENETKKSALLNGESKETCKSLTDTIQETAPPTLNGAPNQTSGVSVPAALSSEVKDEALKNLMMSWYWAGYYTGLYEGKQQAQRQEGEKG